MRTHSIRSALFIFGSVLLLHASAPLIGQDVNDVAETYIRKHRETLNRSDTILLQEFSNQLHESKENFLSVYQEIMDSILSPTVPFPVATELTNKLAAERTGNLNMQILLENITFFRMKPNGIRLHDPYNFPVLNGIWTNQNIHREFAQFLIGSKLLENCTTFESHEMSEKAIDTHSYVLSYIREIIANAGMQEDFKKELENTKEDSCKSKNLLLILGLDFKE